MFDRVLNTFLIHVQLWNYAIALNDSLNDSATPSILSTNYTTDNHNCHNHDHHPQPAVSTISFAKYKEIILITSLNVYNMMYKSQGNR